MHSKILSQHGRDALKILRKTERIGAKVAHWSNHRAFNLRCVKSGVIPPSVRLFSNVEGEAARNILKKAEKSLLEVRLRHCIFTLRKLEIEEENSLSELSMKLPEPELAASRNFLAQRKQHTFEAVRQRQKDKFARFLEAERRPTTKAETKKRNQIQERWVVNKSSKTLDTKTSDVLRKGLNFAVTPKSLPTEEIITSTEMACKNLDRLTAASLRSEVARVVKRTPPPKPNVTREELQALQDLQKDDSIMILPADKGRATVVLDKGDYNSKVETILKDDKTYTVLKKDPTNSFKTRLTNILKNMKKESDISNILYRKLYPTSDQAPRFYGLPKIHKTHMPLRPIVSGIGSVSEGCAKHLAMVLNCVKGKNGHAIRNSADFVN